MKYINRILLFAFAITYNLFWANNPPPPSPVGRPGPNGGGGVGPGAPPASPIDMYVYILIAVGIIMMAYYAKRLQKQNA